MDAYHLMERYTNADCKTLEEVEQVCDKFIAQTTADYRRSLRTFTKKFSSKCMLLENKLELDDICYEFRITNEDFLNFVTELHPHPVYIDPRMHHISVGNTVAKRELKKALEEM